MIRKVEHKLHWAPNRTVQRTQGSNKPVPRAAPNSASKRQASEGVAASCLNDPENGMVMLEDQHGAQRPDCAMMDPGASSSLMGFGPFCWYVDHLKKLGFLTEEITLKKATRTFHFGGDHKAVSSWTVHLPILLSKHSCQEVKLRCCLADQFQRHLACLWTS